MRRQRQIEEVEEGGGRSETGRRQRRGEGEEEEEEEGKTVFLPEVGEAVPGGENGQQQEQPCLRIREFDLRSER